MKYLIDSALEYGLQRIADQVLENKSVHGIIVDLSPIWLHAYMNHLGMLQEDYFSDLVYHYPSRYLRKILSTTDDKFLSSPFMTTIPIDLNWRPEYWNQTFDNKSNLRIRIQLRPGSKPIELPQKEHSLIIVQEYSAIPSFSSKKMIRPLEGGVSIGHQSDSPGTLGGIMISTTGKKYGMTCGHVIRSSHFGVDQPSSLDNPGSLIGNCIHSVLAVPNNGTICNPHNSQVLNELDIALIELDNSIMSKYSILNVGAINGFTPANQLCPNLRVEFNGRTSGYTRLVIGGIGFVQEIKDSTTGQSSCFKNLIELKQPFMGRLLFKRPVKAGDSGAWVVTSGKSGLEWCGMIISENRQSGFAIHSEDIINYLSSVGYNLACK